MMPSREGMNCRIDLVINRNDDCSRPSMRWSCFDDLGDHIAGAVSLAISPFKAMRCFRIYR